MGCSRRCTLATIISDEELKRLTTLLVGKAYKGEREKRDPVLLPGSTLYRIKDPAAPEHFLLQHVFGDEISSRGQELLYLYNKHSHSPLWRMVLDYRWHPTTLISTDVDEKEARTYLQRALIMGVDMDELLKPPDFPLRDLPDKLMFRSSIDGTLRDFNGQRYVQIRRHVGGGMYKTHELYLGEVQGGVF